MSEENPSGIEVDLAVGAVVGQLQAIETLCCVVSQSGLLGQEEIAPTLLAIKESPGFDHLARHMLAAVEGSPPPPDPEPCPECDGTGFQICLSPKAALQVAGLLEGLSSTVRSEFEGLTPWEGELQKQVEDAMGVAGYLRGMVGPVEGEDSSADAD